LDANCQVDSYTVAIYMSAVRQKLPQVAEISRVNS